MKEEKTVNATCDELQTIENSNLEEQREKEAKIAKSVKNMKITQNEKMPRLAIRFDGIQHMPDFDDNAERRGFRCKFQKCGKQTTVFCEKCNVHLCFLPGKSSRGRNCFKKFHQLKDS